MSPWRMKAAELCQSSGKVNFIKKLLLTELPRSEKVIIVTDFPVVSELIFLFISRVLRIQTGFFHSQTRMTERKALVEGFQEMVDMQRDPSEPTRYLQEFRPRVLVAVTGVIAVGFTLTIAANLIKLEPNYSAETDKQVFKRIHRIGQRRPCTIWRLLASDSQDEKAVLARAENKALFIEKAYDVNYGTRTLAT